MKRFLTISLFLFVIPVSVFAMDVKSDYDRDVNLSRVRTYAFAEDVVFGDELTDKRMKNAIRDSFADVGVFEAAGQPDVIIEYYVGVQQKKRIRTSGYGRPFWGVQSAWAEDYTDGTAVVDFIDARTGDLVWRGMVTGTVTLSNADSRTKDAIGKLAKQFSRDRGKQAKANRY